MQHLYECLAGQGIVEHEPSWISGSPEGLWLPDLTVVYRVQTYPHIVTQSHLRHRKRLQPHSWNTCSWASWCISATLREKKRCEHLMQNKTRWDFYIVEGQSAGVSVALTCWESDPEHSGCSAARANKDTQCQWCRAPEMWPSQNHRSRAAASHKQVAKKAQTTKAKDVGWINSGFGTQRLGKKQYI